MCFDLWGVHVDRHISRVVAVVFGRELDVVTREEVLGENPRHVRLGQRNVASFGQCRRCYRLELFPSCWCFNAGSFQCGHVVVQDWGRRVERHADHFAVAICIEITNASDVVFDVELNAVVVQQILNRDRCALGADYGRCTGVKHLHDVWLLACAECCDTRGQGFFVAAFVDRNDGVLVLACVEVSRDLVDGFAQLTAHCVPPGDFGFSKRSARHQGNCCGSCSKFYVKHWKLQ